MATCEACGGGSDVAEHIELPGVKLCFSCRVQASAYGAENIGHMVEQQRRRSSPQPEAGPMVRDADGVVIAVGDVLWFSDNGEGPVTVTSIRNDGAVFYEWPRGGAACSRIDGSFFRHAPSPAKPPGGEDVGDDCRECGNKFGSNPETCATCCAEADRLSEIRNAKADAILKRFVELPPTLAAFDASVQQHLVPLLPQSLRCVTDIAHGGQLHEGAPRTMFRNPMMLLWVFDGAKRVHETKCFSPLSEAGGKQVAGEVASKLMADLARKSKGPR